MSLEVLPSIRKNPRLEWRMASETARLAALVASFPWTSTPMPISVIQRTRAIGFPSFVKGCEGFQSLTICVMPSNMRALRVGTQSISTILFSRSATRCADPVAGDDGRGIVRRHDFSIPRRETPGLCMNFVPPKAEGAGKAGCRLHPWVPCNKKHGGRTTGSTGITPAFPAQWFTAYFVLSPVTGLFCHRRLTDIRRIQPGWAAAPPQDLTPASGCQDHTTSPSATCIVRLRAGLSLTGTPPCDHLCAPTLPRPPHPAPRP